MTRLLALALLAATGLTAFAGDDPPKPADKKPEEKNLVVLTPAAAAEVKRLMKQHAVRYLRVSVANESEYKLDLDDALDPAADYLGSSLGVPVVVEKKFTDLLPAGLTVDFVNANGRKGFSFGLPELPKDVDTSKTLPEARKGFKTTVVRKQPPGKPAPEPPANVFAVVRYDAVPGKLTAYLSPDPKDGKKHPAIVWITGGDCNSIDSGCYDEQPEFLDQSASQYRKAGVVMMFPALRGGNDNPGAKEGFFGEVDDVIAAGDHLRKLPYVDPERVYLGGHSTGGTLVLLVSECTDRFRAVFSFGPASDVGGYGPRYNPFRLSDPKELALRAPVRWLHGVKSPTFVFEGTAGNADSLRALARTSKNPKVVCVTVKGANHFTVLAPTNRLIAAKLLRDTGPECNLTFTGAEVSKPFGK